MKMDFSCPSCNVLLQVQTLGDTRLWKCTSCEGLVISLPIVRKGMGPKAFKKIWQKLYSGETENGRPCPGCKDPLSVVEAEGQGGAIMIDMCRTCQILWFDDKEFSDLPKAVPEVAPEVVRKVEGAKKPESRVLTPEELTFAAFKQDQYKRRSFLFKLLDGSVSKELGFDSFFGDFFDQ